MAPDPLAEIARLEGVPSAFAAARDALDLSVRRRRLRPLAADQLATSRRQGAAASAELSGDPARWRAGSAALAAELDGLSPLILVAPLQAIARAHLVVASGSVAKPELGRIRPDPAVAHRMQGLAQLLTDPTKAPAAVLAAVAHAEVAVIAPFGSADDLIARAVERAVLIATGVDPQGVLPVEAGHLRLAPDYRRALQRYATGGASGVRDWLLHCAAALQEAAALQGANEG